MRTFRFYNDNIGWFIDLPEWTGDKYDLQMVLGADIMLDILAQGNSEVHVTISDDFFEGSEILTLTNYGDESMGGAYYKVTTLDGIIFDLDIWLCDVTKFVFNSNMPEKIYLRKEF